MQSELGVSFYDFVRGARPWSQLYRLIGRFPRHSHFHAAVMDDEDSVRELLDSGGAGKGFGMQGWTYERELLTTVVDVLGQIHATLIQVNSENARRPVVEPMRRPKTALDRVEAKRSVAEHEERVRQWLGK